MKSVRAFTLVELVVVIGIVAVLTGLIFPAFRAVRRSAQVTSSVQQLHQIQIACTLYQQDWDGVGRYGSASDMGLPSNELLFAGQPHRTVLQVSIDLFKSPCGSHPGMGGDRGAPAYGYWYLPSDSWTAFRERSVLWLENTPLVLDQNCNDHDIPLRNPYLPRRGLGVLLSGQLINRVKAGDLDDWTWWSDPPL